MLQRIMHGEEGEEFQKVAIDNLDTVIEMYRSAAEQEKEWADYLFKDGSMLGLNAEILKIYVEYITDVRIKAIGLSPLFNVKENPLPWMNHWLNSDNVQVAPQETEITSYVVAGLDIAIKDDHFKDFKL